MMMMMMMILAAVCLTTFRVSVLNRNMAVIRNFSTFKTEKLKSESRLRTALLI
jgi:hypothetical protein